MPEQAPTRHEIDLPSGGRRGVVWAIAVIVALHSFLVMLWVMPVNPIRDAVGQQRLQSYINNDYFPFEQSWSVFAPTPRRGGENVVFRAFIGDPKAGTGKLTNWYDVTADEDARIKYLVNPSRIHSATRRMGGNVNAAVPNLSERQRLLLRGNFVETSPKVLYSRLVKLSPAGKPTSDVTGYIQNDEMLTRFLTMYATARWGEGVSMVQFRVGHRSVPNYSKRRDVNFLDVPFTYYSFGFRRAIPAPTGDAQKAFDRYVEDATPGDFVTLTKNSKGKITVEKGDASK
ncbi:MAG: DUF5819 family protein [Aeromicrobium sp.]